MLAGLHTAAAGLNNAAIQYEKSVTSRPILDAGARRPVASGIPYQIPAPSSTTPQGVFSKDNYGKIYDPAGGALFYDATGRMDIAEDGTLLEDGAAIGRISIYNVPGPYFSSDSIISTRLGLEQLKPQRIVDQIISLRAFQANASVVRTADEMLGTILDMVS